MTHQREAPSRCFPRQDTALNAKSWLTCQKISCSTFFQSLPVVANLFVLIQGIFMSIQYSLQHQNSNIDVVQ